MDLILSPVASAQGMADIGVSRMALGVVGGRGPFSGSQAVRVRRIIDGHVASLGRLPDCIVSGGATGVDAIADEWARARGLPALVHVPSWTDKGAGLRRNTKIVESSTHLLAIPSEDSIGTWDTIRKARAKKIPVTVVVLPSAAGLSAAFSVHRSAGVAAAGGALVEATGDAGEGATGEACVGATGDACEEVAGDLFAALGIPGSALGHCVAQDFRMGAGIAAQFKRRFSGVDELLRQHHAIGCAPCLVRDGHRIYYLVTKEKSSGKPTLGALREALRALRGACVRDGVTLLCLPRLGCGLDRLDWVVVRDDIRAAFGDSGVRVRVYSL